MAARGLLGAAAAAGAAAALVVGLSYWLAAPAHQAPAPRPVETPAAELFEPIARRYRLEVRWRLGPGFFPEDWVESEARAEPIDERELRRMPAILEAALSRYPVELITRNLRRVCLARGLSFYGQPFGGTNDSDTVYLSSAGEDQGFDDRYLAETFHHELSSILMRNHDFPAAAWRACNPEGFEYDSAENGGVQAIANARDGLDGAPEFYELGLLSEYARSELEEDFNTYCEVLMTDPERLRRLGEAYPVIRRKHELCRAFYEGLGVR